MRRLLSFALLAAFSSSVFAAPGDVDPLDAAIIGGYYFGYTQPHASAGGFVSAFAVQPDGRVLVGGHFSSAGAIKRNNIFSLSADGLPDLNWATEISDSASPLGFDGGAVTSFAVQADGKALVAADRLLFSTTDGVFTSTNRRLLRTKTDQFGTIDPTFLPTPNAPVSCMAVQADGKLLIGGSFTALQPNGATTATARNYIARLNSDGTIDTAFNPNANSAVRSLVIQADGKVLLGGQFTSLQPNGASSPTTRNRIARLNADGTLDAGFNPSANNTVVCMATQADGKVLLGAIYLTPLDEAMAALPGIFYRRYMDDWVILAKNRWALRRAVRRMNEVLTLLDLRQHPDKTWIGRIAPGEANDSQEKTFDFLGMDFSHQGLCGLSAATAERVKEVTAQVYDRTAREARQGKTKSPGQVAAPLASQAGFLRRVETYRTNWQRYLKGILAGFHHHLGAAAAQELYHRLCAQHRQLSSTDHWLNHFPLSRWQGKSDTKTHKKYVRKIQKDGLGGCNLHAAGC